MSTGRWEFDENGNVRYVDESGETQPTDGSYHYSYRKASPGDNAHPAKKNDDGWHWALIILGFVAFWPVGLVLLFLQLAGRWPGTKEIEKVKSALKNTAGQAREQVKSASAQRSQSAPGNYGQTIDQVQERLEQERVQRAQRQAQAREAVQAAQAEKQAKKQKKREKRKKEQEDGAPFGLGHIRLFRWIGGIMTGIFGFAFVMELIDDLTYSMGLGYTLRECVPLLAFALIGVTLLFMAGSRKRKLKKFQKYLSMVGKRDRISITSLAEAMGVSEKQAEKDLEEMLERDFWEEGYVDAARRMLVLGSPLEDTPPEPEIDQEAVSEDDTATSTLRHIRQVNDAIADADMSEKIYHIEELTGKIFRLLEERPEKSGELRSFMNYYLPQTLKILESYSKLEAQGIEGENISEAKEKIEGMMDKLVDGYETQLDKLFADDVLDISADLKVMEQMLEKDGLALDELKPEKESFGAEELRMELDELH